MSKRRFCPFPKINYSRYYFIVNIFSLPFLSLVVIKFFFYDEFKGKPTAEDGSEKSNLMMSQLPVKNQVMVSKLSPVAENLLPATEGKLGLRHSLLMGELPSVAMLKDLHKSAWEVILVHLYLN
jgi:hypothetical protein